MTGPTTVVVPDGIRHVIMVAGTLRAGGRSAIAAAVIEALRFAGCTVGAIDADLAYPTLFARLGATGRATIDGDERIVPADAAGVAVTALADFVSTTGERPIDDAEHLRLARDLVELTRWGGVEWLVVNLPAGVDDRMLEWCRLLPRAQVLLVGAPGEADALRRLTVPGCDALGLRVVAVVEHDDAGASGDAVARATVRTAVMPSLLAASNAVPRNIVLIGFRGTGKTTVAAALATALDRPLVDVDKLVKARLGGSVLDIVREQGWGPFQAAETQAIAELQVHGAVIDCGGGAVIPDANVAHLKRDGMLFFLKASPMTIAARLARSYERPPLRPGRTPDEDVREELAQRLPRYAAVADVEIDTDGRTVTDIVAEIADEFAQREAARGHASRHVHPITEVTRP